MPPIIEGPPEQGEARRPPLGQRLIWFVVLWLGSLIVVAAVAYAMRALIIH